MCCGNQRQMSERCDCAIGSDYRPRFMTKEQKIAKLEKYLAGLQEEAKAVKAHIAEMKQP